jgi:hypothetical protein
VSNCRWLRGVKQIFPPTSETPLALLGVDKLQLCAGERHVSVRAAIDSEQIEQLARPDLPISQSGPQCYGQFTDPCPRRSFPSDLGEISPKQWSVVSQFD